MANIGVPIILVGDFNSSPKNKIISFPPYEIIPPYQIIGGYGFKDAWTKNPLALLDPTSYTCCQDAELDNRKSRLSERIDLVFVRGS